MDWKLIFQLSLFGLAMAFATVFLIPPNIEPAVWLVIFLICAYVITKRRPAGPFVHGVLLGLVNSVWITAAHILLFDRYIAGHPQEAAMMIHAVARFTQVDDGHYRPGRWAHFGRDYRPVGAGSGQADQTTCHIHNQDGALTLRRPDCAAKWRETKGCCSAL